MSNLLISEPDKDTLEMWENHFLREFCNIDYEKKIIYREIIKLSFKAGYEQKQREYIFELGKEMNKWKLLQWTIKLTKMNYPTSSTKVMRKLLYGYSSKH